MLNLLRNLIKLTSITTLDHKQLVELMIWITFLTKGTMEKSRLIIFRMMQIKMKIQICRVLIHNLVGYIMILHLANKFRQTGQMISYWSILDSKLILFRIPHRPD